MGMNRTVIMKRWQINSLLSGSQLDELWALGDLVKGSVSLVAITKHLPNFSKPSWSHPRNGHNRGVNFIGMCGKKWDNKCSLLQSSWQMTHFHRRAITFIINGRVQIRGVQPTKKFTTCCLTLWATEQWLSSMVLPRLRGGKQVYPTFLVEKSHSYFRKCLDKTY